MDNLLAHLPQGLTPLKGMELGTPVLAGDIWQFVKPYHYCPQFINGKWEYQEIPIGATCIVEYRAHFDGEYDIRWIHGQQLPLCRLPLGRTHFQERVRRLVPGRLKAEFFAPLGIQRPSGERSSWKAAARAKYEVQKREG